MGLNAKVEAIVYKNKESSFGGGFLGVSGRLERTEEPRGNLRFDEAKPSLNTRWNQLVGIRDSSLRNIFKKSLEIVRKNHANYQQEGKKVSLLSTEAWIVFENPDIKVTYRHQDKNSLCDSVTVQVMQGGWKVFTLNISIDDGVGTFVEKALAYMKEEEDPYLLPLAPLGPAPARKPMVPPMVSVNPPAQNQVALNQ